MHRVDESDFAPAYRDYIRDQWLRFSLVSTAIAASLVPVFSVLDYYAYPDRFQLFFWLRLSCSVVIVFLSAAVVTRHRALAKPVTVGLFVLIQLMILFMVAVTEGALSTYYAGLNLTVIAIGLLLPTKVGETIAFCLFTIVGYVLACWYHGFGDTYVPLFGNLFFLISTGVIASFSSHFLGRRRLTEFRLSYELEQRNHQLAEMGRQKSEFFANISHELRTPLTLILAPVQDLLEGAERLSDTAAARLVTVRENALRLLKLVNDLLDVIRLEEGGNDLQMTPVELNSLVARLADDMSFLADTKDVTLERNLHGEPLVVGGDLRALEKILINLLSNSVKFTNKDGQISVGTSVDSGEAKITVEDTGIGISESDLPYVFDRFRQADGSSTRRFRGTGLGLALVKELTERMGGSVQAESHLGKGTRMVVKLPLSAEAPRLSTGREKGAGVDALEALHLLADERGGLSMDGPEGFEPVLTPSGDSQLPSVLVVEDEPDMRRYLVDILDRSIRYFRQGMGGRGCVLGASVPTRSRPLRSHASGDRRSRGVPANPGGSGPVS